jgi:hypothetical protein
VVLCCIDYRSVLCGSFNPLPVLWPIIYAYIYKIREFNLWKHLPLNQLGKKQILILALGSKLAFFFKSKNWERINCSFMNTGVSLRGLKYLNQCSF